MIIKLKCPAIGKNTGDALHIIALTIWPRSDMVYASNPSTWNVEAGRSLRFKPSLVYIMDSRPVKATVWNPQN